MKSLSALDRDMLFLVFIGHELTADDSLPLGERYQLAGHTLPAARVRALQVCGLIRSIGKQGTCETFEITFQGRMALTAAAYPSASHGVRPEATRDRYQPPMQG